VLAFLSLCLPIFAVVLVGLFAARLKLVAPAVVVAIGLFSFNVALPAMLLRLIASQPLSESFQPGWFGGYLGACLSVFAVAMGFALLMGHRRHKAAALSAAAAMGNVGYLAPPLLLPILGPRVAGPVAMSIMAEVAVIIALGSMLMAPAVPGAGLRAAWIGLRGLARNPVILSILGGCLLAATGLTMPLPMERFLSFLGNAAGPTALFALGGTLGRLRLRGEVLAMASGIALAKLAAYPALVWLVLGQVMRLDGFWVNAGVLLAAMPTATNAFVLAQRHDAGAEEVSAGVLLSTLLAALAFPATAWLIAAPVAVP
jgi:malonate transporter and related proteins